MLKIDESNISKRDYDVITNLLVKIDTLDKHIVAAPTFRQVKELFYEFCKIVQQNGLSHIYTTKQYSDKLEIVGQSGVILFLPISENIRGYRAKSVTIINHKDISKDVIKTIATGFVISNSERLILK